MVKTKTNMVLWVPVWMQLLNLPPPTPTNGFMKYTTGRISISVIFLNLSMLHSQTNASKDADNPTFEGTESHNNNSVHNIIKMRKKFLKGLSFEYSH